MNYEDVSMVVYSETLNELGCFKRQNNGEIEVKASEADYEYEDLKSYWQHKWEFVGIV